MSKQTNSIITLKFCNIAVSNIDALNSLVSTGDTGRQPPPPFAPTSGDLSRHNNS